MLLRRLQKTISEIPDFPKKGIVFRDIQLVLADANLCKDIVEEFYNRSQGKIDVVCGIESRGFLFGPSLAQRLNVPFVMIRKQGKLPGSVLSQAYDLEYGHATLQIAANALEPFSRVMIHDDVLATGGTSRAAAILLKKMNIVDLQFSFLVGLPLLGGRDKLLKYSQDIISLVDF